MSYASVAAKNAPSPEEQPHPDPGLLTVEEPTGSTVIDGASKFNVVAPEFKENPHTDSEFIKPDGPVDGLPGAGSKRPPSFLSEGGHKVKKRRHEAHKEALSLWEQLTDYVVRPQVAGGLLGVVNVGLIAGVGYAFYSKPHLRSNTKAITTTAAAALTFVLGEGCVAEQYLSRTPEGQSALQRAKERRHWLANYVHDFVARTNPYKGAVGILNTAVVGGIGYLAYANRNVPWDRRTVSAISAGLLVLAGAEGYVLEQHP